MSGACPCWSCPTRQCTGLGSDLFLAKEESSPQAHSPESTVAPSPPAAGFYIVRARVNKRQVAVIQIAFLLPVCLFSVQSKLHVVYPSSLDELIELCFGGGLSFLGHIRHHCYISVIYAESLKERFQTNWYRIFCCQPRYSLLEPERRGEIICFKSVFLVLFYSPWQHRGKVSGLKVQLRRLIGQGENSELAVLVLLPCFDDVGYQ